MASQFEPTTPELQRLAEALSSDQWNDTFWIICKELQTRQVPAFQAWSNKAANHTEKKNARAILEMAHKELASILVSWFSIVCGCLFRARLSASSFNSSNDLILSVATWRPLPSNNQLLLLK
jgi:hypothetical protein